VIRLLAQTATGTELDSRPEESIPGATTGTDGTRLADLTALLTEPVEPQLPEAGDEASAQGGTALRRTRHGQWPSLEPLLP
jgi:hypothetical protein